MGEVVPAFVIFFCLAAASLGSLYLHEKLPERNRLDDAQATIRLVANIFVVMTSLVLGLTINSAKNRFDSINRDVHVLAAEEVLLDRMLQFYGPEANEARRALAAYAEHVATSFPGEDGPHNFISPTSQRMLDALSASMRAIKSTDPQQLAELNLARTQLFRVVGLHAALVQQAEGSIPTHMVVILVTWLILIFASFGYRAPRAGVIVVVLVLSAAVISASLYLIIDMDGPFTGPIHVSRAPLERAAAEMRRSPIGP